MPQVSLSSSSAYCLAQTFSSKLWKLCALKFPSPHASLCSPPRPERCLVICVWYLCVILFTTIFAYRFSFGAQNYFICRVCVWAEREKSRQDNKPRIKDIYRFYTDETATWPSSCCSWSGSFWSELSSNLPVNLEIYFGLIHDPWQGSALLMMCCQLIC